MTVELSVFMDIRFPNRYATPIELDMQRIASGREALTVALHSGRKTDGKMMNLLTMILWTKLATALEEY